MGTLFASEPLVTLIVALSGNTKNGRVIFSDFVGKYSGYGRVLGDDREDFAARGRHWDPPIAATSIREETNRGDSRDRTRKSVIGSTVV